MDGKRIAIANIVVRNLELDIELLAVGVFQIHLKCVGGIVDIFLLTLPDAVAVGAFALLPAYEGKTF